MNRLPRHLAAVGTSAAAVAAVTGLVYAVRPFAPDLALAVLYLFAVLPVAVLWGLAYALPVSAVSMLAFNWFFLPPQHTLELRDSENWVALAVFLVTSVVVSGLAARARSRAVEAGEREREAALLASVSATLLECEHVQDVLGGVASLVAAALGTSRGTIELESQRRPEPHESAHELSVGGRHVGRLFLPSGEPPRQDALERLLPPLASLLAVALDRERFARKAVEAETLRRSDAAKTALLRVVSHDLRSPLTAIRAATEGLTGASFELDDADRATLLDTIVAEARRLERLVANLLDLSRLQAGAATPMRELWTMDGLVGRALVQLGEDAARVAVTLPPGLPPVRVDAAQIERVLVNLVENALKFSSSTEPVEIRLESKEGEVLTRVVDRGPGLAQAELDRVFEPFERARTPGGGTGLGLAIVRGFAETNGGRVWAEPGEGAGTAFVLALPAAQVPARVRA